MTIEAGSFHRWRRGRESNSPSRICNRRPATRHTARTYEREPRAGRLERPKRALLGKFFPIREAA
jgi:hypothetical protein